MSGRLVILPHKSWNVWNRENRERVQRDERLHREELETQANKEKALVQEQNLETLLRKRGLNTEPSRPEEALSSEPFRLFGDVEAAIRRREEESILQKLKKEKEQKEQKLNGVAPWAFADGAVEKEGAVKPWYLRKPSYDSAREEREGIIEGCGDDAVTAAKERELQRKIGYDPMKGILKVDPNICSERKVTRKVSSEPEPLKRSAAVFLDGSALLAEYEYSQQQRRQGLPGRENHGAEHQEQLEGLQLANSRKASSSTSRGGSVEPRKEVEEVPVEGRKKKRKWEREAEAKKGENKKSKKAKKDAKEKQRKKRKRRDSDDTEGSATIRHRRGSDKHRSNSTDWGNVSTTGTSSSSSRSSSGSSDNEDSDMNRRPSKSMKSHSHSQSGACNDAMKQLESSSLRTIVSSGSGVRTERLTDARRGDDVRNDALSELRKRRLERERVERKRTSLLLAEADIYGRYATGVDIGAETVTGTRYNQQYNPRISRV
jgi:hypothetical protein